MSDFRQREIPGMPSVAPPHADATEAGAVARVVARSLEPRLVDLTRGSAENASALLLPQGMSVHAIKPLLDAYLPRPARRAGATTLHDLPSFVAAVLRAAGESTVVYLDANRMVATAVFDHDDAGPDGETSARWQGHRACVTIGLSAAWSAWGRVHGTAQSQTDFATFVEDRLADILDPGQLPEDHPLRSLIPVLGVTVATPAEVVAASRGLRLRAEINVTESITLASGETELVYSEEHKGQDGGSLKVPAAFLVALPVFDGAPRDVMLVRLRYRRIQGQPRVMWTATVYQREEVLATALRDLVSHLATATGCPVYLGEPPAARG